MVTKTSAARPEPADSMPTKIKPINLLCMISLSFPNSMCARARIGGLRPTGVLQLESQLEFSKTTHPLSVEEKERPIF